MKGNARAGSGRALLVVVMAVAIVLTMSSCFGDDPKRNATPTGVLTPQDLPATPSATRAVKEPPQLSRYCSFSYGTIFFPGYKVTGIEYSGVKGAKIVNTVHRPEGASDAGKKIDAIRGEFERCDASTGRGPDGEFLRELPLSAGRFGFRSYASDASAEGEMGFAVTGATIVTVSVYFKKGGDAGFDLEALLSKALSRAKAS